MPLFSGCLSPSAADVSRPRGVAEGLDASLPVKVYGMKASTCTQRVMATCEEKGIPYEVVNVDLMKGEQKTPAHLARQPFGKIPALEDPAALGSQTMFESRAMARHLASSRQGQGTELLGKDAAAKAATETWMEVEAQYFNPPMATLVYEHVFKAWFGAGGPDAAIVAKQLEELGKVLDVYEAHLSRQPYLTGQEFSLADLSHLPYTQYLLNAGVTQPFFSRPAVKAWWERCNGRASWKKVQAAASQQ